MAVPPCGFVGTTTFLVEVGLGVLDARGVLVHLISPVAVKVGVQEGGTSSGVGKQMAVPSASLVAFTAASIVACIAVGPKQEPASLAPGV